jgi:hypothetical protein
MPEVQLVGQLGPTRERWKAPRNSEGNGPLWQHALRPRTDRCDTPWAGAMLLDHVDEADGQAV